MPQILTPDMVEAKYGTLFCKSFITMVDDKNGCAQIVETCSAKGPREWDFVNRKRTGGIITDINSDGEKLIMNTVIGDRDLKFGPASSELGGQGVFSLQVEGDRVRTKWRGIAGASVGVGACIPQCKDVIETVYPDDFKIGGANTAEVEIVTKKLVRMVIGVDDTDTPQQGASWVSSLKMGKECPYGKFIDHKIIQLNPKAPNKTTNCCSTAVSLAVEEKDIPNVIEYAKEFLRKESYSDDTVMTVFIGLKIPKELEEWSWNAKSVLYTVEEAKEIAERNGVQIVEVTGNKGTIGAVAAIGCFDLGIKAAGVPEDFE